MTLHVDLTRRIIAACQEVHSVLGPGLEERFYRDALLAELQDRGMCCAVEAEYPVSYKGRVLGKHRVDMVVEGKVLLELKAVPGPLPRIFVAQAISERRAARLPVALLVNFGDVSLQVRRLEDRTSDDVQLPDQRL
ncbi:MAG: GxxExxY protein [Anaerolineae bacterium]